ncbi:MAG: type II secretion system protein [Minisyncoccia bacterium]
MKTGFTLIELLIVIAILAILATAVLLVLNPAELLRQARDSTKISDLAALNSAISLFIADTSGGSWPGAKCNFTFNSGAGAPWNGTCPSGSTAAVNTSTLTNGNGWVPLNFSSISSGSPLSKLPIDPVNNTCTYNGGTSATCQYGFFASSTTGVYEIDAVLESVKYYGTMQNDGGNNSNLYEVGNNLSTY